ncbi:MAG: hypothetical protein ACR2JY_03135 [Chloroflexota bacterium]
MYFLLDEDVDARLADVLRVRGHAVEFARDRLGRSAADNLIAAAAARLSVIEADRLSAIVVTRNTRHFRRLIRREVEGQPTPYPRAGLICLACHAPNQVRRLEKLIEIIEAEFAIARRLSDPRMIVEIGDVVLRILR